MEQIDVLVDRSRMVDGVATSLLDVGYNYVGIDEGWELCINQSQHNADGWPTINTTRFPDMKALVQYGHKQGTKMGWYMNGCACNDPSDSLAVYDGDVNALNYFGFDAVKLDDCGGQKNLTLWAELINQTRRPMEIENCHWGMDLPNDTWCPFNFYRINSDTCTDFEGCLMPDAQGMLPYLTGSDSPRLLSQPGCWAYLDMLEVGNTPTVEESRTNFGLWAILSSPLTLSFDLRKSAGILDRVWDFITNREVIAVNQEWAGSPGRHVTEYLSPPAPRLSAMECNGTNNTGWKLEEHTGLLKLGELCPVGDDINWVELWLQMKPCDRHNPDQIFNSIPIPNSSYVLLQHNVTGKCLWLWGADGPQVGLFECMEIDNEAWEYFPKNGSYQAATGVCLASLQQRQLDQVWAKQLAQGRMAVMAINAGDVSATMTITLSSLGLSGMYHVRDLWNHRDLKPTRDTIVVPNVASRDSVFVVLTPQHEQ